MRNSERGSSYTEDWHQGHPPDAGYTLVPHWAENSLRINVLSGIRAVYEPPSYIDSVYVLPRIFIASRVQASGKLLLSFFRNGIPEKRTFSPWAILPVHLGLSNSPEALAIVFDIELEEYFREEDLQEMAVELTQRLSPVTSFLQADPLTKANIILLAILRAFWDKIQNALRNLWESPPGLATIERTNDESLLRPLLEDLLSTDPFSKILVDGTRQIFLFTTLLVSALSLVFLIIFEAAALLLDSQLEIKIPYYSNIFLKLALASTVIALMILIMILFWNVGANDARTGGRGIGE